MPDRDPSGGKIGRRQVLGGIGRLGVAGAVAGSGLGGVGALAAPSIVRAQAPTDDLHVYAWSDYITPEILDRFQAETGMRVRLSVYGSNEEALSSMRALDATSRRAGPTTAEDQPFDVVFPSLTSVPLWLVGDESLLLSLDETRFDWSALYPQMRVQSAELGGARAGKRYAVPFNWGTEAIAYDTERLEISDGQVSYADLWRSDLEAGRAVVRARSALMGIGLMLDDQGVFASNRMVDAYAPEPVARAVFERCLAYGLSRKCTLRAFWSDAQSILRAFEDPDVLIGQVWDGPGLRLQKRSEGRIRYQMPREGGLAWMDGMAIPRTARNVEGAYAWMAFQYRAEVAAMHARGTGYNSCIAGAVDLLPQADRARFSVVYPPDAIERLWWWRPGSSVFSALRQEMVDRFMAAPAVCVG